ncbi:uncharacterized protein LOC116306291 isoform X3 [Actinia tenebrosa]|uniref:Uncharacterized protein LOC116306291 isoform X3 n=1 Tax=Actinia tenebrosa TaxID=6105 RepID=A0A6P8IYC9_ACTTE|nr:uncharacterized protein LOC116306291 isoform X3 [Actinia tenebrosa]
MGLKNLKKEYKGIGKRNLRSRTQTTEAPVIFDPDGMRIVRGTTCISSEFRQRSYTDPTDLLWVFRRRWNIMLDENDNEDNEYDKTSNKRDEWSNKDGKQQLDMYKMGCDDGKEGRLQKSSNESLSSREGKHSDSKGLSASSDSDPRDSMEDSKAQTDLPSVARKISAPAFRMGRRSSQVQMQMHAHRRSSVSALPRRMARRGSEVPALTSLARRRNTLTPSYPVGLKRRGSRGFSNAEFHLNNIQTKAKHEMLANLVLPAFAEPSFRGGRERRITYGCPTAKSKKDEKRFQVTNEILETEKKYLACLNTLKNTFEDPMREGNFLTPKEIDIIFPNELGLIRESHTHFMKDLEERIENWKQYGIVGDIFTKLSSSYHVDVLKIYSDYVNNFPRAMAIINKSSRSSQKFKRFLQACSTDPDCEGLDLGAYLLTPIQRLPRYVLLLRQLSKSTEASHPDSFHLENALEKMKNMINILNDSIQSSCKIVNVSISRKSTKRKSLRKRPGIKDLKITKEDNDSSRSSQDKTTADGNPRSLKSPTTTDSPLNSPISPPDVSSTTQESRLSPSPESQHSVLTRVKSGDKKSRPVSTGDLDRFYDADHSKEFNAIIEEGEGNDKAAGQSKFRIAAESVKRSWQRRSKKWRRSFEGKCGSTSTLPDLGRDLGSPRELDNSSERFPYSESTSPTISPSVSLENTKISDDTQRIVACNPLVSGENSEGCYTSPLPSPVFSTDNISGQETDMATSDVTTIKETEELTLPTFPDDGSPYMTHRNIRRKHAIQETRPCSVALPLRESSTEETGTDAADKSQSDNNLLTSSKNKTRGSECDAPENIWVPRQRPGLQKRSSSDGVRQQYLRRKVSNTSSDHNLGSTSTSRGSLDKSKDSLIDSGVSGTPDYSPANTLSKNMTKTLPINDKTLQNMEKFKQLSLEERLGFEEIIASGFGENQRKLKSDEELDKLREGAKSKKKFKDVVKQIFSKKKRKSVSSLEDALQAKKSSKILTRSRSLNRKDSKDISSSV